jgi:hypothetical protein
MRAEAMVALRKTLQGAGRGSTDLTNKEILKTLKATILDKALIMRSSSAEVKCNTCGYAAYGTRFQDVFQPSTDIASF